MNKQTPDYNPLDRARRIANIGVNFDAAAANALIDIAESLRSIDDSLHLLATPPPIEIAEESR